MFGKNLYMTVAIGVAAGTGLVLAGHPDGAEATARDAKEYQAEIDENLTRMREIDTQITRADARSRARIALVHDLIAGRLGLAEVAVRFGELNAELPAATYDLCRQYPRATEDERLGLNVLSFVNMQEFPPEQMAEVNTRLEAEFEAAYGRPPEAAK